MLDYIGELDQKGVVPKQILVDVKQRFPAEPISQSTVNRILKIQRADRRDGEAWSPRDPIDGVDVAVAIAALASLISSSDGRRQRLTVGEAQRISFVRRAAPDIPIDLAFRVAQMYARTTPATVLDAYLGFAPWRGDRERRAYLQALDEGWLPRWSPETLGQLLEMRVDALVSKPPEPDADAKIVSRVLEENEEPPPLAAEEIDRLMKMAELEIPGSTTPPTAAEIAAFKKANKIRRATKRKRGPKA